MYICICNAIKDKQVDSCVAEGACEPGDVFARMGCQPVCGKCIPEMRDSLQNQHISQVKK